MLLTTKALVLRAFPLGERKVVVDVLTEQEGRLSLVATVPKAGQRAGARRGGVQKQLLQPLTLLELEADVRPQVQLQRLRSAHVARPWTSIPFDARKLSIALFLAEFIYYGTRAEQRNDALFAYIEHSVGWLDACAGGFANFHLVFMMRLTRFVGFYPNTEGFAPGHCFDLRAACFTPDAPLHPDFLPPADAARIGTLMRMNYDSMHLFRMSHADRNRIADVLARYYRLHVPGFPELRSLDVLRQLWAEEPK